MHCDAFVCASMCVCLRVCVCVLKSEYGSGAAGRRPVCPKPTYRRQRRSVVFHRRRNFFYFVFIKIRFDRLRVRGFFQLGNGYIIIPIRGALKPLSPNRWLYSVSSAAPECIYRILILIYYTRVRRIVYVHSPISFPR